MSASAGKVVPIRDTGGAATNEANATVVRYRDAFAQVRAHLPGQKLSWVQDAREAALANFSEIGLPKPRDENWKYTRIAAIERRDFILSTPAERLGTGLGGLLFADALQEHQLVFLDGVYRSDLSTITPLPGGALICDLRTAFEQHAPALAPYFDNCANHEHGFTALNTAFAADGALIKLDEAVEIKRPVHLLFVASSKSETIAHPRIVIDCAKHAKLTVVEHFCALGDANNFNNALTQVNLAEGAALTHYKLQREATKGFHVATLSVQQQRSSSFTSHSVSLGAALARNDINVVFAAPDSYCMMNGLYITNGRQHVDYHTRVDHAQPSCTSNQDYRGILDGRSRGVFNACAYVHPHAQQSDATQSNKNILLSNDAEIDTKPQLEIYANDVKCAHGVTVGQLDEEKVFYLRSRGISEQSARGLLTYGFARAVLDRMQLDPVREIVTQALLDQLPNGAELRSMLA
jgi:Fe-S cluster assembly protein SufD